jgi:hypothetical protein
LPRELLLLADRKYQPGENIMNDELMTVNLLWDELDDYRAENLNGGYNGSGSTYLNVSIAGGVGSLQQNAGDGYQNNYYPVGNAPYYPYRYY